jgi:hypothetical protein
MRGTIAVSVAFLTLACAAPAGAQEDVVQELSTVRKFFPKNWMTGFMDFAVAPPHNEPDLNRCAAGTGSTVGANLTCAAFARYVAVGSFEFRPIATGFFRRSFVFVEPRFYLGNNLPQVQYTDLMTPIAMERTEGIGIGLPRNFELRLTNHRVDWIGHYNRNLGVTDLGKSGPLSLYTTFSARWYFGGYRPRD